MGTKNTLDLALTHSLTLDNLDLSLEDNQSEKSSPMTQTLGNQSTPPLRETIGHHNPLRGDNLSVRSQILGHLDAVLHNLSL